MRKLDGNSSMGEDGPESGVDVGRETRGMEGA